MPVLDPVSAVLSNAGIANEAPHESSGLLLLATSAFFLLAKSSMPQALPPGLPTHPANHVATL